jgi:ABC-type Fe3+ transport system permease subunit
MVLPITSSIVRISPSLEEAAQNLGASGEHVARDATAGQARVLRPEVSPRRCERLRVD